MKSVAVVTATTGRMSLQKTVDSIKAQTHPVKHYIFTDCAEIPFDISIPLGTRFIHLPVKTGGNGIMNGGILAASAYLVTEELICWLDDDNWFEPNHIEELVKAKGDHPYAHSLRKLVNPDGTFYDYDDFESLGVHSGFVDLNCYLMDIGLARQIAPLWYNTTGTLMIGDRYVYQWLSQNNVSCGESGKYTLNYTLNAQRDLRSWLFDGNIKSRAKYSGELPWRKE